METGLRGLGRGPRVSRRAFLKFGVEAGVVAGLAAGAGCGKRRSPDSPNIVLVTLDTTRADHLSCYGYHRRTSPILDRLAAESVLYTDAISSSSWTLPAHATLFTGKFVTSHGARYDPEGPLILADAIAGPDDWDLMRARGLSKDETTLAGILKDAGYATGAVVGGPWLKRVFGLHKGFDYYDDDDITELQGRLADRVTARALAWLAKVGDRPFFLFLNYFDAHFPYCLRDEFSGRFLPPGIDTHRSLMEMSEEERSLVLNASYDGEIRFVDHHFGRILDMLKERDLYDSTWIIVTADHGQLLGEHDLYGHGEYLYQEEIHIPLFAKYPWREVQPRRSALRLQLTDILPMVLERLDIARPPGIQGSSPDHMGHPVVAELYPLPYVNPRGDSQALFEDNFKFVLNRQNYPMLIDLSEDPRETNNLITKDVGRAKRMESTLVTYLASLPRPGRAEAEQVIDEDTQRAIRNLGYL